MLQCYYYNNSYNGARQAEDIVKFINENAGTRVVLKKATTAVVVVCTMIAAVIT